jgi:hypothetical protein
MHPEPILGGFMKSITLYFPLLFTFLLASCSLRDSENEFSSFINQHLKMIEPKLKALNIASWNANATGEKKYYDEKSALDLEVRTIYSNKRVRTIEEMEGIRGNKECAATTPTYHYLQ